MLESSYLTNFLKLKSEVFAFMPESSTVMAPDDERPDEWPVSWTQPLWETSFLNAVLTLKSNQFCEPTSYPDERPVPTLTLMSDLFPEPNPYERLVSWMQSLP